MLSLMDTKVSLVVKVLWKFVSLIYFRVYLEVNVHKNPTCFSRWSVRLVSSILALKEGTPVCPNTSEPADELIKEIKSLDSKHNIVSTLSGLNVAIDFDEKNENKKNNYYILILDYTRKRMRIKSFETKNIEVATEVYNQLEGDLESDKNIVLVSASSFDSLRAAYPNYFTDIQEFVDMMRSLYDNLNKFIN